MSFKSCVLSRIRRGLCHGQQNCRLWPPVGRAHLDSEEGKDQAKETHDSVFLALSRESPTSTITLTFPRYFWSVGTFGPNFERPLVARAFPQARLWVHCTSLRPYKDVVYQCNPQARQERPLLTCVFLARWKTGNELVYRLLADTVED